MSGLPIPAAVIDKNGRIAAANTFFRGFFQSVSDIASIISAESIPVFRKAIESDKPAVAPFKCLMISGDAPEAFFISMRKRGGLYHCFFFHYTDIITPELYRTSEAGKMLSVIAHQWKQPLNSLALIVQNLADERQDGDDISDMAMRMISYMSDTVNDFIHYLTEDSDSVFDIKDCVPFAMNILKPRLDRSKISTCVTGACGENMLETGKHYTAPCDRHQIFVHGRKNELQQVLITILTNASEAVENRADRNINVRIEAADNTAVITVKDTGGGIPDNILDRVFEPHFTTKTKDNGNGIGLFLARQIVEKHFKGKITAKNSGKGAMFSVSVPLARPFSL